MKRSLFCIALLLFTIALSACGGDAARLAAAAVNPNEEELSEAAYVMMALMMTTTATSIATIEIAAQTLTARIAMTMA